MTPDELKGLDNRLIDAADHGDTKAVQTLLAAGANVHAAEDLALRRAAYFGHTQTVRMLLEAGANVHAQNDQALRLGAYWGYADMVQLLANHIFVPDSWRGKSRAEIEAEANTLYDKIKVNIRPERSQSAGTLLADCAIDCWQQVRPPPPPGFKISPLPAQPRAL
jgi:ankyrin repeat protein